MKPVSERTILTVSETVQRAKENEIPISAYSVRQAVKSGALPCRKIGSKYLIAWPNFEKWLMCEIGTDCVRKED